MRDETRPESNALRVKAACYRKVTHTRIVRLFFLRSQELMTGIRDRVAKLSRG
jgi:hypothetical protein